MRQSLPTYMLHRRRGVSVIYTFITMTVLLGFLSLGVDLGRAQLAKTQLQAAADAAALYGAQGLFDSTASSKAIAVAAQNLVDAATLTLQSNDVTTGYWSNGTFSTSSGGTSAIRVRARKINSRGTGIPLLFAGVLGRRVLDITVDSYATGVASTSVTITAQAKANPWLAGMPNGTTANDYDSAPIDSPAAVTGLNFAPGDELNFDFDGGVSYLPNTSANGPDGDSSFTLYNHIYTGFSGGREHGMSNLTAPITAVVGVFLNDNAPNTQGTPPSDLDFSTLDSRDFASLSPALRQPFFIGDGMRNDGTTAQKFVVPAGATRLYIAVMDGQQWSDNSGSFNTNISHPAQYTLVK